MTEAMLRLPSGGGAASSASARPTNTPTIRRRYQSLATASVNGSQSSRAAAAAAAMAASSSARARDRGLRRAVTRIGCGPAAPSAIRAPVTVSPSIVACTATVTTAGVLAALRPNLTNAVRPASQRDHDRGDQLVGGQARRHEAGPESRPAAGSAARRAP